MKSILLSFQQVPLEVPQHPVYLVVSLNSKQLVGYLVVNLQGLVLLLVLGDHHCLVRQQGQRHLELLPHNRR